MQISWGRPDAGRPPVHGRAVAVTGLGVVACCGIGKGAFWAGLLGPAPTGERRVSDFDPTAWFGPKEVRRVDRFAQLTVAAAEMAVDDAGELSIDPDRAGVVMGAGVGGIETLEEQVIVKQEKGARRVTPFLVPMMMANAGSANVSMRRGWRGPCETVVTACASGTHAIAGAARLVAAGRCDVMLAGGAEAPLTEIGLAGFNNMTALSSSGISRPFDVERDGFVIAEGAAAVVLEDLERALARGAHLYALVLGAASTADAHHITAPSPGGAGAASCMEQALADAGVEPEDVGHVNAHGTSTPLNDQAEAEAIAKVFGSPGPPVTSVKGITGHALAGAGAIEAVASALSVEHRLIPPTARCTTPDPELGIDVVTGDARSWEPGAVISNSFGFGGHNGSLVLAPA
jgi:3-oxoacyl-[acyl-carrier-protein] synthase II